MDLRGEQPVMPYAGISCKVLGLRTDPGNLRQREQLAWTTDAKGRGLTGPC